MKFIKVTVACYVTKSKGKFISSEMMVSNPVQSNFICKALSNSTADQRAMKQIANSIGISAELRPRKLPTILDVLDVV